MKKLLFVAFMAAAMLTSCNQGKLDAAQQEIDQQKALNEATTEELQAAITERDELLDIINGISSNVEEIKRLENIITVNTGGEGNSKTEIANSLDAIRATLADRRQKLAQLEAKLKESKLTNDKLLDTIEKLKFQIESQDMEISMLSKQLDEAHKRINELDNTVNDLNNTVQTVTDERDSAREEATRQADLANECYYAVGSKKELKEHNIVEGGGFLRKNKIMQGEFDKDYFVKADKRTLKQIQLHSKKAKIITTAQPKNSYDIIDVDGQKVLTILNPTEFWGTSNFVVIQID